MAVTVHLMIYHDFLTPQNAFLGLLELTAIETCDITNMFYTSCTLYQWRAPTSQKSLSKTNNAQYSQYQNFCKHKAHITAGKA
jgi:hypothetical protein